MSKQNSVIKVIGNLQLLERQVAVNSLLTLGKVQPESMIAMACLPAEDFKEAVKIATSAARTWNDYTVQAEKDLNEETMPSTML